MVEVTNHDAASDVEMKRRVDKITKELSDVWGETLDDKLEINDVILDAKFAEFLLKNEIYLNTLKTYVENIKNNWWTKRAWASLDDLIRFLDDLWDNKGMEKDYKKFMDKLRNPMELHKMKDEEVRKLCLYLSMNEKVALDVYQTMKSFEDVDRWFWSATLMWTGMNTEDIRVFQSIKKVLKDTYQNNETFIEAEYPGYQKLSANSQSIKSFLETYKWELSGQGLEWEWDSLTIAHICDKKNSIVNREAIVAKLNELNNQRIESNKKIVEAVNINLPVADFTKTAEWVLKFRWSEFTANDVMMFNDEISAAITGGDFVNDREKSRLISECKNKLFDNMKNKLLSDPNVKTETSQDKPNNVDNNTDKKPDDSGKNPDNNTNVTNKTDKTDKTDETDKNNIKVPKNIDTKNITSMKEYVAEKNMVNIKDVKLKNRIIELWFCESLDWDTIVFNKDKVEEYLMTLQNKSWSQLRKQKPLDRKVWIVAVQVALNHLDKINLGLKPKYAVKSINWLYNKDTKKCISIFQKTCGFKVPDGKPWPKTIKELVTRLRWYVEIKAEGDMNRTINAEDIKQQQSVATQVELSSKDEYKVKDEYSYKEENKSSEGNKQEEAYKNQVKNTENKKSVNKKDTNEKEDDNKKEKEIKSEQNINTSVTTNINNNVSSNINVNGYNYGYIWGTNITTNTVNNG